MIRLLITGGGGFVGKHVVQQLLAATTDIDIWTPNSQQLDLTNHNCINDIIKYQPHVILHMAAKCGGILANKNSPADFLRDNTQMALNIFEAAKLSEIKYVYTLGSVCAYPKYCPVPFREDNIWNGPAEETNFPYGQAKRTLLMLGQTYRQQYDIKGAHLIPVNMYGAHDHFDLVNSHVIPALIRKFDDAITINSNTVECWGTGEASREFLFVEDCAEAITKAILQKLDTDFPINLGTGYEIVIKDLASLIGKLMNFQGKIIFDGSVSDGQPRRMLDVSRAKQFLNWGAPTDLTTGLIKTIEWYNQNKFKIKK